jgi:hypothetical protein
VRINATANVEAQPLRIGPPPIRQAHPTTWSCEWFLVPLFVVDEAVDKIKNGTIADYIYDPHTACLRRADRNQTLA